MDGVGPVFAVEHSPNRHFFCQYPFGESTRIRKMVDKRQNIAYYKYP